MTPIELLKILRKGFICLILWNVLISGILFMQFIHKQEENLSKQICNLEMIPDSVPDFELMEVE